MQRKTKTILIIVGVYLLIGLVLAMGNDSKLLENIQKDPVNVIIKIIMAPIEKLGDMASGDKDTGDSGSARG